MEIPESTSSRPLLTVIDWFESTFDRFDLMRGNWAVPKRMVIGFLAASAVVVLVQPESMFVGGMPLEWSVLREDGGGTMVPWWVPGIITGLIFGVFI